VVSDATLLHPKPFCAPPAPTGCPSMVAVMALTLPILVFYSVLYVFVKIPLSISWPNFLEVLVFFEIEVSFFIFLVY
jgi:uncharacterized paraquat-inducible protein A